MKTDLFQSCGRCWIFQICWHIECSTFKASSFRIWNSSTWILSSPLALFIVMLSKAHLTSHSRISCFSHVQFFAILCTEPHQALLSMGFSKQEYWSTLLYPPPGDLPHPGSLYVKSKELVLNLPRWFQLPAFEWIIYHLLCFEGRVSKQYLDFWQLRE